MGFITSLGFSGQQIVEENCHKKKCSLKSTYDAYLIFPTHYKQQWPKTCRAVRSYTNSRSLSDFYVEDPRTPFNIASPQIHRTKRDITEKEKKKKKKKKGGNPPPPLLCSRLSELGLFQPWHASQILQRGTCSRTHREAVSQPNK